MKGEKTMRYYLIRKMGDEWLHLYPEKNGLKPVSFTFEEAEITKYRYSKLFGSAFRIISESDFNKFEVPKRW